MAQLCSMFCVLYYVLCLIFSSGDYSRGKRETRPALLGLSSRGRMNQSKLQKTIDKIITDRGQCHERSRAGVTGESLFEVIREIELEDKEVSCKEQQGKYRQMEQQLQVSRGKKGHGYQAWKRQWGRNLWGIWEEVEDLVPMRPLNCSHLPESLSLLHSGLHTQESSLLSQL